MAPRLLGSQERGATALGDAILGLGVNTRVLMIGAHPDDEDTFLIAWLSRGRHVKTAYLSLTRGDGGQNLIGNELGEALGVIRTEELLAARRIDGADQYFTRAYDFGFSKDTVDTYTHWPKDSILGDVVRVVRAFKPHVIVAVFSGTPRDGHGQHQVSGLLAREAYDLSGDTVRFPVSTYGRAWTTSKFYRAARGNAQAGTLGVDVGEYSPLLGRSYAEIAGQSLSQHGSQGFGVLQRKGPVMNYVRREATRVNESTPANGEKSILDGIDTSWTRFRVMLGQRSGATREPALRALDSLPQLVAATRNAFSAFTPGAIVPLLLQFGDLTGAIRAHVCGGALDPRYCIELPVWAEGNDAPIRKPSDADLERSLSALEERTENALRLATGNVLEVLADRDAYPVGKDFRAIATLYNRGTDTVTVMGAFLSRGIPDSPTHGLRRLAPGGFVTDTLRVQIENVSQPWWLSRGRNDAMFATQGSGIAENTRMAPTVTYIVGVAEFLRRPSSGPFVRLSEPVTFRFVDDVRGEVRRRVAGVPALNVNLGQRIQYVPANTPVDREVEVRVSAADSAARDVRITLMLPEGLRADSATRTLHFERPNQERSASFRVRGRLSAGNHRIVATAVTGGETFTAGYDIIDYEHIRRQRIYRNAEINLSTVDVRVPGNLSVAYVPGVGDNVAAALAQLGIPVTVIPAADVASSRLSGFTTLVIGPRAYEAHPELIAASQRILDFARRGGTVVVQYGQYEMTQPGIMPYPITIARPHDRVTHEDAPVTFLDPQSRLFATPNRITAADFDAWVQDRSLYMPRTFDDHYRSLLAMSDPGETPNRGGVLIAPVGSGLYIYTTLAFFRQLPAGVPGAARLFVNLLSAGINSSRPVP